MLIKETTEIFPTKSQVGLHLVLKDNDRPDLGAGEHIVIDEDITENYTPSEGPTVEVRDSILKKAQNKIDIYKKLKALKLSTKYTNAVSYIHDNLDITE